jgi:hypothetical protein
MRTASKLLLAFLFLLSFTTAFSQNDLWKDIPEATVKNENLKRVIIPEKYRTLALDTLLLKSLLQIAPKEFSSESKTNPLILSLPMPDGSIKHFSIVEYSMMEPGLQAIFPDIKTYSGQGIEDRTQTIKIDWTAFGFHAMVLSPLTGSVWIDPYARGDKNHYISYRKSDLRARPFTELAVLYDNEASRLTNIAAGPCLAPTLRSYRLAVSNTGEYAAAVGGTTAPLLHSAIVTTVNRVNGVYEQEVAVRLVLIANNNLIEFLTAAGDPYTGNNDGTVLINESQTVINGTIGAANYDIGHTFSTGGGGLAQFACVCVAGSKARGVTGLPSPTGDAYDIDFVAHEIGHQFGGSHTFNAVTGNCLGNATAITNAEPGSGSTIMAYAGICTSTNDLQLHSDPNFHALSFDQIGTFTRSGGGSSCGTAIATTNTAPVVNAGLDYTIPISTPFKLSGSATDINGDTLTYSWEQVDIGGPFSNWNVASGSAPLFRSFAPVPTGERYFPRLSDVINSTTTIGEIMPGYVRSMKFRLTVRDNHAGSGGICFDEATISTSGATAFNVTSQAAPVTWTANGSNTATITWTVAGTTAAPFNVANVDILLSVDGGFTYPYTLAGNTPNDGTQVITIPAASTSKGRVMVRSVGNVFYDINTANITITSACPAEGAVVAPANTVTAIAGSAVLNLGLSPQYSSPLTIAGSLQSTDPVSSLAVFNSVTSACVNFLNEMKYDTYTFTPGTTATYTFTLTSVFPTIMNLYANGFDGNNSCTNFLKSTATFNGTTVAIGNSIAQALTAGNTYVLVIGTFDNGQPPLPAAYSVAVSSSPAGGNIYGGNGIYLNPGAGFSYAYVVVNNSTGIIKGISATANLTSTVNYPAGSYTVYGLSYSNSILNLNSFVNGNFSALVNSIFSNPSGFCANFSKNVVTVNITAGPVPVSFLELTARKSGNKVVLDWKTVAEQNSSHFIIERSADGTDFSRTLGEVTAAGNSNSLLRYSFLDNLPLGQWNYYRVAMVDLNSEKQNSNIAAVYFDRNGGLAVLYPNPASAQLNIEFTGTANETLSLQVIDTKGSVVLSGTWEVLRGRSVRTLDISKLSAGVYILRYQRGDGQVSHLRFIKQ